MWLWEDITWPIVSKRKKSPSYFCDHLKEYCFLVFFMGNDWTNSNDLRATRGSKAAHKRKTGDGFNRGSGSLEKRPHVIITFPAIIYSENNSHKGGEKQENLNWMCCNCHFFFPTIASLNQPVIVYLDRNRPKWTSFSLKLRMQDLFGWAFHWRL